MQIAVLIPWSNQHWDAIHVILVERKATKKDLHSEKIWAFNCFRQKLASGKFLSAEIFIPGHLRR